MITIEPTEEQEWYLLSEQGLEEAYSQDEPDHSLERIKIPNPEYQP